MVIATPGYPFVIFQVRKSKASAKSSEEKATTGEAEGNSATWHSAASQMDAIKRGVERR
jgi:hypothetical protein